MTNFAVTEGSNASDLITQQINGKVIYSFESNGEEINFADRTHMTIIPRKPGYLLRIADGFNLSVW